MRGFDIGFNGLNEIEFLGLGGDEDWNVICVVFVLLMLDCLLKIV